MSFVALDRPPRIKEGFMRRVWGFLLLFACMGGIGLGVARAGTYFVIRPMDVPYRNVGLEAFYEQFNLDIDDPVPGDDLFVEMTPHLPDGWLSQFCVTSSGSCFLYSHQISIPSNGHERLQIDFVLPFSHEPGTGYIDVRIYRVDDPTTWQEASFALGYGETLPVSRFTFTTGNAFQQTDPNTTVQFTSTIRSFDSYANHLIATVQSDMPPGWFAQFCQVSTGVCYFGNAVIPFPALATDQIQVDFFCFNPDPAIGNFRLKLQSEANPSMWTALSFRVRAGSIPADAGEASAPSGIAATIAPNPVRDNAEIRLDLSRTTTGARIRIVDIAGRAVLDRVLPALAAGSHRVDWDGRDDLGRPLPSGTYFYRVLDGSDQAGGKLTIDR
jgi:hypothetical protein